MDVYQNEHGIFSSNLDNLPAAVPPGSFILDGRGVICAFCVDPKLSWAELTITAGCVHEHIQSLTFCRPHASVMIARMLDTDDVICHRCTIDTNSHDCKVEFISQRSVERFVRDQAELKRLADSFQRSNRGLGRSGEIYVDGVLQGSLTEPIRFPNG